MITDEKDEALEIINLIAEKLLPLVSDDRVVDGIRSIISISRYKFNNISISELKKLNLTIE